MFVNLSSFFLSKCLGPGAYAIVSCLNLEYKARFRQFLLLKAKYRQRKLTVSSFPPIGWAAKDTTSFLVVPFVNKARQKTDRHQT